MMMATLLMNHKDKPDNNVHDDADNISHDNFKMPPECQGVMTDRSWSQVQCQGDAVSKNPGNCF